MTAAFFAWVLSIAPAAPAIHLDAPPEISARVIRAVALERPAVEFVDSASAAQLAVSIVRSPSGYTLTSTAGGRRLETRELGAELEPAVRLAVLLVVERADEVAASAPREVTPRPEPPPPSAITTTVAPVRPLAALRAELALGAISWASPFAPRPTLSLAVLYRWEDDWLIGARLVGAYSSVSGESLDAEVWLAGALLEARLRLPWFEDLWIAFGAGASYEAASGQIDPALFPGPTKPEPRDVPSVFARAGLALDVAVSEGFALVLEGGVVAWGSTLSVELPEYYENLGLGEPLVRGRVAAHLDLAVTGDLF